MSCDADTLFLYRHGQYVAWAAHPGVRWRIVWRRYTERDILGPIVEYLLEPMEVEAARTLGGGVWAAEPDVTPEEPR